MKNWLTGRTLAVLGVVMVGTVALSACVVVPARHGYHRPGPVVVDVTPGYGYGHGHGRPYSREDRREDRRDDRRDDRYDRRH